MKEKNYCYEYPRPALSTDCVIFGFDGAELRVLLIERGGDPFKGYWALPGGFVQMDESAEESAARELLEETGLENIFLKQLHTFTAVHRHPVERVITVAYYGLIHISDHVVTAGDDAKKAQWFSMEKIPELLAFDHDQILSMAKKKLRCQVKNHPDSEIFSGKFSWEQKQLILGILE
jgi:8-oxo-dGTP diphosphatase